MPRAHDRSGAPSRSGGRLVLEGDPLKPGVSLERLVGVLGSRDPADRGRSRGEVGPDGLVLPADDFGVDVGAPGRRRAEKRRDASNGSTGREEQGGVGVPLHRFAVQGAGVLDPDRHIRTSRGSPALFAQMSVVACW